MTQILLIQQSRNRQIHNRIDKTVQNRWEITLHVTWRFMVVFKNVLAICGVSGTTGFVYKQIDVNFVTFSEL